MIHKRFSIAALFVIATMVLASCGTEATPTVTAPTVASGAGTAVSGANTAVSSGAGTAVSGAGTAVSGANTAITGGAGTAVSGAGTAVSGGESTATTGAMTGETPSAMAGGAMMDPKDAAMKAAGGKQLGGSVNVLAVWAASEQDAFLAMVKPFEDATGTKVEYESTRDLNAVLTTRVQGGNPPDLAGLPGPGQMAQFAQQGKLVSLADVLDMSAMQSDYAQSWIDLASYQGKPMGIFIKSALKGLIWYDPKQYKGPTQPKNWDELMTWSQQTSAGGTTPWCIGLESGAASGWPATDWVEDIVLRQAGPEKYDQWYQGTLPWTSPEIKTAFDTFGKIAADPKMVFGGPTSELTTNFGVAGDPLFKTPPGCYLHHQGSFITDFFTKNTPGVKPIDDFNFFGFPDINPQYAGTVEAAGDLFGMFKDTPQARALIKYLTTPEAQAIWVKRGGALSANKRVPLDVYPDPLSKQAAQVLVSSKTVRFDASDLMPDAMSSAFSKALLSYVQNPGSLDTILTGLDAVQKDAYKK